MNFNPEPHLATTERTVTFLEVKGQPAAAVALSRVYPTAVADLWDAVTNDDRISNWFAWVSGNLEPGGRYHVEGNASGLITECVPRSHFALTWEFGDEVSWVDVSLSQAATGQVRLSLTHTALLSENWDTYGPGAVGVGWEMAFLGLALHIANPSVPKLDDEEFATSPEGRAFIAGSSKSWAESAIAAGTDPGGANAAAGRTTAFYTGEGG